MLIKAITTDYFDNKGSFYKITRNIGKYKEYNIQVESEISKGKTISKAYTIWTNEFKKIIKKYRRGCHFERFL